jgi:hypothetical protein
MAEGDSGRRAANDAALGDPAAFAVARSPPCRTRAGARPARCSPLAGTFLAAAALSLVLALGACGGAPSAGGPAHRHAPRRDLGAGRRDDRAMAAVDAAPARS